VLKIGAHPFAVNKEQRFPDLNSLGERDPLADPDQQVVAARNSTPAIGDSRSVEHESAIAAARLRGLSEYGRGESVSDECGRLRHGASTRSARRRRASVRRRAKSIRLARPQRITDELPVDVALGKLDYMEIVGFSGPQVDSGGVGTVLLNLGFKIPAGAGTDATTNYAAPIRGMVGMDFAFYVWVPAWPLNLQMWMSGLRHGRTFATNGLRSQFHAWQGNRRERIAAKLRSAEDCSLHRAAAFSGAGGSSRSCVRRKNREESPTRRQT